MKRLKKHLAAYLASRFVQAASAILALPVISFLLDQYIHNSSHSWKMQPLDVFIGLVNPLGNGPTMLLLCLVLWVLSWYTDWPRLHQAAWFASWAFVIAGSFEFAIKHLIGRPRPDSEAISVLPIGPSYALNFDSFPSGHSTILFAVASAFGYFYPKLRWPLYLLAACVAFGRVYLDRHYLSDVLAGAIIGILASTLILRYKEALPTLKLPARKVEAPLQS